MNPLPEDDRLTAYALGELPAAEAAEVEALLKTSDDARREVEEIRRCAGLLTEAFGVDAQRVPEAADVPSEAQVSEFPGAVAEPVATPEFGVRRPWGPWLAWGLAAGVTVLALVQWWPEPGPGTLARHSGGIPRSNEVALPQEPAVPSPTPTLVLGPQPVIAPPTPLVSTVPLDHAPVAPGMSPGPLRDQPALGQAGAAPAAPVVELASAAKPELSFRRGLPAGPEGAREPGSAGAPPISNLSPESRSRYGFSPVPSPAVDSLSVTAPARESARQFHMEPQLMKRSGSSAASSLGDQPTLGRSPASSMPVPADRYYREERLLHRGEREELGQSERGGQLNPGYVDAGENAFVSPLSQPLSTFGLDVDTGSYANVRRFLKAGALPPRAAVRVEEMLNYFDYAYPAPAGDEVFSLVADVTACPWQPEHRLVRLALKTRDVGGEPPVANLVFLVDVSGSMQPSERLPLLKEALRALAKRLAPADRVAIVTYAGGAEVRLPSTSGEFKDRILEAIDSLVSGGSTNGEGGIRQAYAVARQHFIAGGVNRVLLCTDGDFNVGLSDQDALVRLIQGEAKSGVFLTTLGVGTDNFKDALMRRLADSGNGSYHYLDSFEEAQRVLIEQQRSRFVVAARDAKAQVEFNPSTVAAWRLVGYEKRLLPAEAFNDDTKDGGEVGAGQTVTVLYEVVPAGGRVPGAVDALKYQPVAREEPPRRAAPASDSSDLLTLKLRYQRPEGSPSVLRELAVREGVRQPGREAQAAGGGDLRFSLAVVAFAQALRDPSWHGGRGYDLALELAQEGLGADPGGVRAEFLTLVRTAKTLAGRGGSLR